MIQLHNSNSVAFSLQLQGEGAAEGLGGDASVTYIWVDAFGEGGTWNVKVGVAVGELARIDRVLVDGVEKVGIGVEEAVAAALGVMGDC